MPSIRIRAAAPDDATAIAGISVRGWRAAYRGLMPDEVLDALSVDERTQRWIQWIASPPSPEQRVWVLEDDARVLAFAATGPEREPDGPSDVMEVYAIYVEPDRVASGLGAAIFRHALADLTRRGMRRVVLWVLDRNQRAMRFYEHMGMVRDGTKTENVRGAELPHVRYAMALARG